MKYALVIVALHAIHCWAAELPQQDGAFHDKELYAAIHNQLEHCLRLPAVLSHLIIEYAEKEKRNPDLQSKITFRDKVSSIAWSPDEHHIVVGHDNGVETWNTQLDKYRILCAGRPIYSVSWSPCGKWIASGGNNGIRIFGTEAGQVGGSTHEVFSVGYAPLSNEIATGHKNGSIGIFCPESCTFIKKHRGNSAGNILSVAWSPCNTWIVGAGENGVIIKWDKAVGGQCWKGHVGKIRSITWSPQGNWILSAGDDMTIRKWCPTTLKCARIFRGHTDRVWSVSCSPNERWIASGSDDKTVRIWNLLTGACLKVFQGHTDYVTTVVWSPSGDWMASGSEDKTARIWPIMTYDVT